ncbi:hypothetical protein [Methylobacterium nodulans]|uniref:Uncharacterized protein n=1 Tax=Methylobacterium nodulans (strain LMG 21967 / CNCM I-2342 / ORS 2060) TaxID=460265 RepID=B8IQM3_METNO|nr:hypothetical protein [Methylobacterium nodulans]ACL60535.1 conserved hypothetical protein [Methylobacterium nodulans ORS 2060]
MTSYEKAVANVNRQYDELRRNLIATTDAGNLPGALATNETARAKALQAFSETNRKAVRDAIAIPDDYYAAIRGAESSGDDSAVSKSGAVGRYQFISSAWLEYFPKAMADMAGSLRE